MIVATGREREAIERLEDIVRDELNVHELRFVSEADELGQVEVKPNYRTLGPRFGKQMPMVAAAVAGLDPAHVAAALREGRTVAITIGGDDHALGADDLLISMKPLEGYQVEREGSHAVALEIEIDDALRIEGWARDIVRAVQNARQAAGSRSQTGSCSRSTATPSCWTPPARTRPTSPARRWPRGSATSRWRPSRSMIDGRPLKIGVALAS